MSSRCRWRPQSVPLAYWRQAPPPSQVPSVPQLEAPLSAHWPPGWRRRAPACRSRRCPPRRPGRLPVQAVRQQALCSQKPLEHSVAPGQRPLASCRSCRRCRRWARRNRCRSCRSSREAARGAPQIGAAVRGGRRAAGSGAVAGARGRERRPAAGRRRAGRAGRVDAASAAAVAGAVGAAAGRAHVRHWLKDPRRPRPRRRCRPSRPARTTGRSRRRRWRSRRPARRSPSCTPPPRAQVAPIGFLPQLPGCRCSGSCSRRSSAGRAARAGRAADVGSRTTATSSGRCRCRCRSAPASRSTPCRSRGAGGAGRVQAAAAAAVAGPIGAAARGAVVRALVQRVRPRRRRTCRCPRCPSSAQDGRFPCSSSCSRRPAGRGRRRTPCRPAGRAERLLRALAGVADVGRDAVGVGRAGGQAGSAGPQCRRRRHRRRRLAGAGAVAGRGGVWLGRCRSRPRRSCRRGTAGRRRCRRRSRRCRSWSRPGRCTGPADPGPAGTVEQVPPVPVSAHDMQVPVQAVRQQTPCAQNPLSHSVPGAARGAERLRRSWPLQTLPVCSRRSSCRRRQLAAAADVGRARLRGARHARAGAVAAAGQRLRRSLQVCVPQPGRARTGGTRPAPLHDPSVPQVAAPESAHWFSGSVLAGMAVQTPRVPSSAHDMQMPVQAPAQQTPCWQEPEAHSAPARSRRR